MAPPPPRRNSKTQQNRAFWHHHGEVSVSVSRKVSAKAGRYLVFPDFLPVFQIRIPKALVGCRNVPPLRMGLGAVSRREARRLAVELAVMARRRFVDARWQMEVSEDS